MRSENDLYLDGADNSYPYYPLPFVDNSGGTVGGGGNSFAMTNVFAPSQLVGENVPTQKFDISALAGLRPQDKYLGRNRVSDIQEAYQTYLTGNPIGRGGQYAVDAARKYGTTLTEAARGYLVAAGLPTLAEIILPDTGGGGGTGGGGTGGGTGGGGTGGGGTDVTDQIKKVQDTIQKQLDEIKKGFQSNDTVKVLSDSIKELFGNAVYTAPLQNQSTGYTPVSASAPIGEAFSGAGGGAVTSGGSSIGKFIILGIVGVVAYFLYKRFAS